MILISVSDYNRFSQDYYDSVINALQFHQLSCTCGRSACLSVHAYYKRGLLLPDGIRFLRICRLRCSECGRTHALLLSSMIPYDRISLLDQHKIVRAFFEIVEAEGYQVTYLFDERNAKFLFCEPVG